MHPRYFRQICRHFLRKRVFVLFTQGNREGCRSSKSTFWEVPQLVFGGKTFKVCATHWRSSKTGKNNSQPEVTYSPWSSGIFVYLCTPCVTSSWWEHSVYNAVLITRIGLVYHNIKLSLNKSIKSSIISLSQDILQVGSDSKHTSIPLHSPWNGNMFQHKCCTTKHF